MIYTWLAFGAFVNAYVGVLCLIFVLMKSQKTEVLKKFGIFCFFMTLWALGYFFPIVSENETLSFLSFRLLHLGAIFIAVAHLDFIIHFLRIQQKYKWVVKWGYIFNIIITLLVPTKWFIESMSYKCDFAYWANVGMAYHIWLAVWLCFIIFSVILLLKHYNLERGIKRKQIGFVLLGDIITFTFGSTNFFLFYDIEIIPYFNVFSSGQMLIFAYAIARYRFGNIELNFLNFLQKTISFILAFISLYLVYFYLNLFFIIPKSVATDIVFLLVSLMFYHFFEMLAQTRYFSQLFRLSDYDNFHRTVKVFNKKHGFTGDLKKLENKIKKTFIRELNFKKAELIILDEKFKKKYPEIIGYFKKIKKGDPLIYSELELTDQDSKKNTVCCLTEMKNLGEACFPIYDAHKNLIACFILGEKPFKNPYYIEEIKILKDVCHYLSLSLAVINYYKNLAKEVKEKTKQINEKNKQLKNSYKELQKMDKVKDEFLSIASHELRTPLTVIKGYTDFLLQEDFGKINKKQSGFLGKILISTNSLLDLINKMLDISYIESGKMKFSLEEINLVPYLKHIKNEFGILYKEKNIKLTIKNIQKLNSKIFVDSEKLHIIFANLLGNSYKFTSEKGKVCIEINEHSKKFIKISIIDNGIGIPREQQKYVFKKFQQVENSLQKQYAGTGLGLNITKQIIEKFGGKIWIENLEEEKAGIIFSFTLPLQLDKKSSNKKIK